MNIDLRNGDAIEQMKLIPNKSIDLICCDLPYGKIRGSWDCIIPITELWKEINRIIKNKGVTILFGNEPFSSKMRIGNLKDYKYDIKWVKNRATGFANCNYRPMNKYEDIMVFSKANASVGGKKNSMAYNPQGLIIKNKKKKNVNNRHGLIHTDSNNIGGNNQLSSGSEYVQKFTNYPSNIHFEDVETEKNLHPTQKPLKLIEFLVKTFSNEKDTVLDMTIGSGTTAIACINTSRNFIGIELDKSYFEIAKKRVEEKRKEKENEQKTLFDGTN